MSEYYQLEWIDVDGTRQPGFFLYETVEDAERVAEAWKKDHPFTEVVCEILPVIR